MNVLFLAKEPLFYVEYAARLENHGVPFWTAHTTNDFHVMLDRMSFDLVFADYNFIDFSKSDIECNGCGPNHQLCNRLWSNNFSGFHNHNPFKCIVRHF